MQEKYYTNVDMLDSSLKLLRAGAHQLIYCDPAKTKVSITTCSSSVPGMNAVIRSLVKCFESEYAIQNIFGVKWGFRGFFENVKENWVKLDSKSVAEIHKRGGSILGTGGDFVFKNA